MRSNRSVNPNRSSRAISQSVRAMGFLPAHDITTLLKVSPPGVSGLATPAHLVSVLTIGLVGYCPSVNVTIAMNH
jgi:hypothetical protein